jgi:hypothetical protein
MVVALAFAPLLMGARKPPEFEVQQATSVTQRRIVEFVVENGFIFDSIVGVTHFFAPSYGCRRDETAYSLILISPEDGYIGTSVCVQDGEDGAIRPAPMHPVAGNYPVDGETGDGGGE